MTTLNRVSRGKYLKGKTNAGQRIYSFPRVATIAMIATARVLQMKINYLIIEITNVCTVN